MLNPFELHWTLWRGWADAAEAGTRALAAAAVPRSATPTPVPFPMSFPWSMPFPWAMPAAPGLNWTTAWGGPLQPALSGFWAWPTGFWAWPTPFRSGALPGLPVNPWLLAPWALAFWEAQSQAPTLPGFGSWPLSPAPVSPHNPALAIMDAWLRPFAAAMRAALRSSVPPPRPSSTTSYRSTGGHATAVIVTPLDFAQSVAAFWTLPSDSDRRKPH